MGTGWSQDETSQSQQQPSETLRRSELQNFDTKHKTTDSNTEAKKPEKIVEVKLPQNYEAKKPEKIVEVKLPHKDEAKKPEKIVEVKLPHNYEAIVKDADSPIDKSSVDKLYDQLNSGVFLNQKKRKYWVEKKSGSNSFMLFARDLLITWADDKRFWHWPYLKETSDEFVDVAELLQVCWLEVHAKFDTRKLSPGTLYQVAYVIMMKDPAQGWEVPVNIRLTLPNGSKQEHKESLMVKPKEQWIEIPVGEFQTSPENNGEMEISMYEYEGGKWKKGLVIKGVVIRPKN